MLLPKKKKRQRFIEKALPQKISNSIVSFHHSCIKLLTMALSSSFSSTSPSIFTTNNCNRRLLISHLPPVTSFCFPTKLTTIPQTLTYNSSTAPEKWRTKVSFFPAFLSRGKDAKFIKEELLEAISLLDRGAEASPEDQERINQVFFLLLFLNFLFFAKFYFLYILQN